MKKALIVTALSIFSASVIAASLDKGTRDSMSPEDVANWLVKGNERFIADKPTGHDYKEQKRLTSTGQHPSAIIHGCIDSRAPAEIVFDTGIGDIFNSRTAGNVLNKDVLGGMEFATAVAGAKVINVMGHTKCGAIKGAIADVELGNLTQLVEKIKPAISKTASTFKGEKSPNNYDYVDAVTRNYVAMVMDDIRQKSPTIRELERQGKVKIIGNIYDISTGKVESLD